LKHIIFFILLLYIYIPAQVTSSHYYYFPVEGKSIGIWPEPQRCTQEGYLQLKKRWGFSSLFVAPIDVYGNLSDVQYKDALSAGFEPGKMIIDILYDDYVFAVDKIPAAYYYLGECVEHDCYGHPSNSFVSHIYSPDELRKVRDYIHSKRSDSKLVIDGYKRCSHFIIAGAIADAVMYSAYCNWNSVGLPVCRPNIGWGDTFESPYAQGSDLQTGSWGDMRSKFGAKFSMSWVRSGADEYSELFASANQLGLNTIWLYQLEGGSDQNLEDFCNAAYENGWLTRIDASIINAPSDFKAETTIPGEVHLSWKDNSTVEKGYIIERKQYPNDYFVALNTIPYETTAFTDLLVEDTTVYTYRIKAYNDYNQSGYSDEATVKTLISPKVTLIFPQDNLVSDETALMFTWNKVPQTVFYTFQFSADSMFRVLYYSDSTMTDTSMLVGALAYERDYYWRIGAKLPSGHTYWSKTRKFTITRNLPGYKISGKVSYMSPAENYPVENVAVSIKSIDGGTVYNTYTNNSGEFSFENVKRGSYYISASKTGGWGGINSADALLITKFFTGMLQLNSLQACAADFNNSGGVNSSDALLLTKMFVGMISSIPNNKPEWIFIPEENISSFYSNNMGEICQQSIIKVENSDLFINLKTLCTGDINGSRMR
jgi:hypothetical protein